MKLTNEQIASILTKEVKCKTILVSLFDEEISIEDHKRDGWFLVNRTAINDKVKLTFKK